MMKTDAVVKENHRVDCQMIEKKTGIPTTIVMEDLPKVSAPCANHQPI